MGFDYFCFHDFDLIQEGDSFKESEKRLLFITDYIKQKQKESGVKVLWGTANCFSNPQYMNGAATNPEFDVLARAGGQVKLALDTTIALNGENYVFWGGREGYMSLLNTDMKRELDHLGKFLSISRDYARSQGFKGNFFIEPKPMEPTKHQYDFDTATAIGFLKEYGLENDFKINIEVNHATLAQHTFQHELTVAAKSNMLGSIDANRGDYQNGWDTDQFPNNPQDLLMAFYYIFSNGGFIQGGLNFDAKIRRQSIDAEDLFYAHIGGMDRATGGFYGTCYNDKEISLGIKNRYKNYEKLGRFIHNKNNNLESIANKVTRNNIDPLPLSGQQELLENMLSKYL